MQHDFNDLIEVILVYRFLNLCTVRGVPAMDFQIYSSLQKVVEFRGDFVVQKFVDLHDSYPNCGLLLKSVLVNKTIALSLLDVLRK